MSSSFSPNLRIELIASGEQANTWGITTNKNLGTLLEQAIAGYLEVSVTATDVTLTELDGESDQSRNMVIKAIGSPTGARTIKCPDNATKVYVVANDTAQNLNFTTVSGSGVTISPGQAQIVYCDGTDVFFGTTSSFTANRAMQTNASGNLAASTITATELSYLSGVTSAIQTQLNAKQATITGAATTITTSNLTASRAMASDASGKVAVSSVTSTELGYVSGVTSPIQAQINTKQATITGAATTIVSSDLTASRAMTSDASGKVAVSAVTSTELGYVSGVTSAIQTQLNGKQGTITGAASTIASSDLSASLALISNASGKVAVSSVTSTELGYLSGTTSAVQTQINGKQATITGGATTITSSDLTASRALVSNASGKVAVSSVTDTELGYVSGVTSAIQTQLNTLQTAVNTKQATITGGATTITSSNLTASRALVSDASGKVAASSVTSTELGYVSGATSNIQAQINSIVSGTGPIPSGTKMLFMQAAAPTGWTLDTTHNNKALRIVNTTGGTFGGSVGFTTAFASQAVSGTLGGTVNGTAITTAQMPSHSHAGQSDGFAYVRLSGSGTSYGLVPGVGVYWSSNTASEGGGQAHNHTLAGSATFTGTAINLAVQYVDAIICTKT